MNKSRNYPHDKCRLWALDPTTGWYIHENKTAQARHFGPYLITLVQREAVAKRPDGSGYSRVAGVEWDVSRDDDLPGHGGVSVRYDANLVEHPEEGYRDFEAARRGVVRWLLKFLESEVQSLDAAYAELQARG